MEENVKSTSPKKEKPTLIIENKMETDSIAAPTINTKMSKVSTNSITTSASTKTLKRCLSVPIIHSLPASSATASRAVGGRICGGSGGSVTTRSAAAAAYKSALATGHSACTTNNDGLLETPKKENPAFPNVLHLGIHRSNPSSREVSPAPVFNIFAPRARRYSASYSPMGTSGNGGAPLGANGAPLCVTPRVSQLRKEECLDMNSREVNHEREIHNQMQMSQSWEDLTLVAENWSCKSDEFSNPLQVVLPVAGASNCSSPSPTSTRAGLRLPYGLSPSPTRRTFATRRSMSPIAMRPSQLGAVKRKFEMDETNNTAQSSWSVCSPPPLKKMLIESRGSSPSSVCPSPDSGTYDGRMTPKFFISKLCTSNGNGNSSTTSCSSASSISSSSGISSVGNEPMICCSSIDEGISGSESEEKNSQSLMIPAQSLCSSSADIQDDTTLMDDTKSETSSIGGCSSISIESSSWDSNARIAPSFLSQLATTTSGSDDLIVSSSNVPSSSGLTHKSFFINKPVGNGGTKKYVVNHDNMPNSSSCSEPSTPDGTMNVSSSCSTVLNLVPQMDASDLISSTGNANHTSVVETSKAVILDN